MIEAGNEMINYIILASVWVVAFMCWKIMKKICPESSKMYLAYVLAICVAITLFGVIHLSGA